MVLLSMLRPLLLLMFLLLLLLLLMWLLHGRAFKSVCVG
jgi:hypothetical protein